MPSWSPDSKSLIVTAEYAPFSSQQSFAYSSSNLIIVSAQSGKTRVLRSSRHDEYEDPIFSPDGKHIAVIKSNETQSKLQGRTRRLALMNIDGTHERFLTNHPGADDYPVWTRDSRSIVILTPNRPDRFIVAADSMDQVSMEMSPRHFVIVNALGAGERVINLPVHPTGFNLQK